MPSHLTLAVAVILYTRWLIDFCATSTCALRSPLTSIVSLVQLSSASSIRPRHFSRNHTYPVLGKWPHQNELFYETHPCCKICPSPPKINASPTERTVPGRLNKFTLNNNNWTKQLNKNLIPKKPTEQLNYWTFASWTKTHWTMIELNKFWIEHVLNEQLKRAWYEVF